MLFRSKSWWLHIALYFVVTAAFVYLLVMLRRRFTPQLCNKQVEKRRRFTPQLCNKQVEKLKPIATASRLLIAVAMTGLCLFGIRGRMGYNPIKVSQAYYCDDAFLNQLGINPAFNLLTSVLDDMRKENRELHLMPYSEAITNTRRWLGITGTVDSRDRKSTRLNSSHTS